MQSLIEKPATDRLNLAIGQIVAVGRIIQHDEISTYADPFVAAIVWMKDQSGYEGWHYCHSVLTVARTLEDEVMVDWWTEIPTTANS